MKKSLLSLLSISLTIFCSFSQNENKEYYVVSYSIADTSEVVDTPSYTTKSTACSNTTEGTIGLTDCADVGTGAFASSSLTDAFDSENGVTDPTPPCFASQTGEGSWHVYDLANGVEHVSVSYAGGFAPAGGFGSMYMAFYQGTDCNNLVNVGCGQIADKLPGNQVGLYNVSATGLDDSQSL